MLTLSVSALRTSLNLDYRPDHVRGILNSLLCHMASNDIIIGTQQRIKLAKTHVDDFHSVISDIHLHQIVKSNDIVNDWIAMVGNRTHTRLKTYYSIQPGTHSHSTKIQPEMHSHSTTKDSTVTMTTPLVNKTTPNNTIEHQPVSTDRNNTTTPFSRGHMTCLTVDYLQYSLKNTSHDGHMTVASPSQETPNGDINEDRKKYTETYRQMEFNPYQPLPVAIEGLLYPVHTGRYVEYDDPLWPNKMQCLELVEAASDGLPRFTGTFLTPEARSIR